MVSCGLLARTVKASQSIVRVKLESMESIELPVRSAVGSAPVLPRRGPFRSARSLPACGRGPAFAAIRDDRVARTA